MTTPENQKSAPSYRLHWCVVLLIAVVWVGWLVAKRLLSEPAHPSVAVRHPAAKDADWFLLVRCPEMPVETEAADAGRTQMKEWITAARAAGFHPLAFTQVLEKLDRGEPLPDKTVVLMFDPAYRTTVEQLLPTLEAAGAPALWVTRSPGRIRADRRFVTAHTRRALSSTPLWDFAVQEDEDTFLLEKVSAGRTLPREYAWQTDLGVSGVNTAMNVNRLNRLHANARWSAQEFTDRLMADVPLRKEGVLSVRPIGDRLWGVVLPANAEKSFELETPADRRFSSVSWEGTRGVDDLGLKTEVDSWFGELWFFLRSDRENGDRIRVGLMDGEIRILQEKGGMVVDDREAAWPIRPKEGLQLQLMLQGDVLRISSPLAPEPIHVAVAIPGTGRGQLELSLYHRLHGVAVAHAVQLTATPKPMLDTPPLGEIVAVPTSATYSTQAIK